MSDITCYQKCPITRYISDSKNESGDSKFEALGRATDI